jgi:hypothetical protein
MYYLNQAQQAVQDSHGPEFITAEWLPVGCSLYVLLLSRRCGESLIEIGNCLGYARIFAHLFYLVMVVHLKLFHDSSRCLSYFVELTYSSIQM